jgi:hypothetical protein
VERNGARGHAARRLVVPGLVRVRSSLAWRLRRLLRALYSVQDTVFWVGDAEDAPWYPDGEKVAALRRSIGLEVRRAFPFDRHLFHAYQERAGTPFSWRRWRVMRRRWARGDACYLATDQEGQVVAYMWAARGEVYVDSIGANYRPAPDEIVHYDVAVRPDRRGSMGFLACGCASLEAALPEGYRRVTSWGDPRFFESFRKFHWFSGLGKMKPLRLVRCTRVLGICFRRTQELGEDWSPAEAAGATAPR